ncbi:MarR family winged helix-turn-helix transcriptional regulator [Gimibacter soli]|uniref:MarR family winged helix-turn-helix transcriptional regulator n=1 Tax=Gimibacter soli TaxID=3024400 RepID=A0AAE9XPL8_9PROT|nr:MarR family winged helix-turn-helix transcriptional regulator [Gimibacter soli]WCL53917.1 MarR family winged helix-turn-helix transcriptional regulator [Gimibacter soli]
MNNISNRTLGTLIRHLLAHLDGDVQAAYDELGVPFRPRFYPIVQFLLANGQAGVNEIAAHIGVSQPAATQTLGEMKKLGLIAIEPGEDRRHKQVSLTDAGLSLAARLASLWQAVHTAADSLDREIGTSLSDLLGRTLEALERQSFLTRIHAACPPESENK